MKRAHQETGKAQAEQEAPRVRHVRGADFKVHFANGFVAYEAPEGSRRFEISFFADRPQLGDEGLSKVEGHENRYKPNGDISMTPVREHAAAINMSIQDLAGVRDSINQILKDNGIE